MNLRESLPIKLRRRYHRRDKGTLIALEARIDGRFSKLDDRSSGAEPLASSAGMGDMSIVALLSFLWYSVQASRTRTR